MAKNLLKNVSCIYMTRIHGIPFCFYRVPGNSAMVTALEEELNVKTPEDVNFNEPV